MNKLQKMYEMGRFSRLVIDEVSILILFNIYDY
jgi:hypothetical protein